MTPTQSHKRENGGSIISRSIIQRISNGQADCTSRGSTPAVWLHTTTSGIVYNRAGGGREEEGGESRNVLASDDFESVYHAHVRSCTINQQMAQSPSKR